MLKNCGGFFVPSVLYPIIKMCLAVTRLCLKTEGKGHCISGLPSCLLGSPSRKNQQVLSAHGKRYVERLSRTDEISNYEVINVCLGRRVQHLQS